MAFAGRTVSIWDTFPQATFMGIPFPVESSSIEGGMRDHVHEYPHTPGGAPEKLGRKLYTFRVQANFDTNFVNYPGLYPTDLQTLITAFELGTTGDLRLPNMGSKIPCYALGWTRNASARIRSGERVDITFREDTSTHFAFGSIVNIASGLMELGQNAVAVNVNALKAQIAISQPTQDLFSLFNNAVNFVLAFQDQANLYDARYGAALANVQNLCSQIDGTNEMQVVAAYSTLEALKQVWQAAQQLSQNLLSQTQAPQVYTNPQTQGITAIAIQLYGDTSRVGDLLSLNPVPNQQRIVAGTPIIYYPASVPPITT